MEATERVTLGIPAELTQAALQTETFKEIVNKLAWAVGSTYRQPYRNPRAGARLVAITLAQQVLEVEGYPDWIGK